MQPTITSKRIQIVIGILAVLILMCLAFMIGAKASERRSRHFCNWSEHYSAMLRPHREGRPNMTTFRPMPLSNGVFGRVLSSTGTSLFIEGEDRFPQHVVFSSSTAIRTEQATVSSTAIQPDMEARVFGSPNTQGQIEAYLIRLSPTK